MLAGDIEIVGQELTSVEVQDIVDCLSRSNVRILCVRDCKISNSDWQKLMNAVGTCQSLLQLNCALGVVDSVLRVEILTQALSANHSLRDVFLHSNPLGDEGVKMICEALFNHPRVVCLDVGDCNIGDIGLEAISNLLPPNGPKLGLQDLVLSANPDITSMGWAKFAIALSSCATLRSLHVDYNNLGDYGVGCVVMSLASNKHMEHLDLEATQLTQHSADLLLYLVRNYPVHLRKLVLAGNDVHPSTLESIRMSLDDHCDGEMDVVKVATHKEKTRKLAKDSENRKAMVNKAKVIQELSELMAVDSESVLNFTNDSLSAESAQEEVILQSRDESKRTLLAERDFFGEKGDKKPPKPRRSKLRGKDEKSRGGVKSRNRGCNEAGDKNNEASSTEEYEEMKEIPLHEIQQPTVQTWVSVTKPI